MGQFKKYRFPVPDTLVERLNISLVDATLMREMVKEMDAADLLAHPLLPKTQEWVSVKKESGDDVNPTDILLQSLNEVMGSHGLHDLIQESNGFRLHTGLVREDTQIETLGFNHKYEHFWLGNIKEIESRLSAVNEKNNIIEKTF